MSRCEKCGFDHDDPGSELAAVQVLVCATSRGNKHIKFQFVTRDGPVRPMTVIPLKEEEE